MSSISARIAKANEVDIDSLDDAAFLGEAKKLVGIWGRPRRHSIEHMAVGRTAEGHRVAIAVSRYNDGTWGDSLDLDLLVWRPSHNTEVKSWDTTSQPSEIIFGRQHRNSIGFTYDVEWNHDRSHCHTSTAQIILRQSEKDAFWTSGNVALLGQVLEAMTVVRDTYNAETPQQARAWQVAQFEASLTPLAPPAPAYL